ncbi:putative conjugative transfer protein TrbJ [Cupriavidus taiwanensis]|uniref:P-type conjugative transfer protein TrbJ n=1 Tax=Cupriavidus taiwanensis TaxID=164546 RepID=UPI000E166609|nr:P-type conjugative transfer protein TrbJ [Cupriavidus taiwanensis]SOZ14456.1 putative conjugative transfer protein TrbJ [Cupriavidus taiwanensis]SOZ25872.1 putative conjugative transfer protein TrbJ [Cupriavidus taiwanensis]SOZ45063.1 putative conjugative transfer protein TrbJ [Cupriavidus taiwanensis]
MRAKNLPAAMLVALALSGPAHAGAVVGATEPTQILNNIQLLLTYSENAQQTVTAMNQYQTMLTNLKQMTPSSLLDEAAQQLFQDQNMQQAFRDLRQVYVNGQQAAYSLAQMNQQFKGNHPGYGAAVNFANAYKSWSDTNLGAAKNAIKLVATHQEAFASEENMINELAYKSRTAEGQMQAVQAGSAISLQLVGQLQKLRQLQMAQVQSQNEFAAAQQSRRDSSDAKMVEFLRNANGYQVDKYGRGKVLFK